MAQIPDAETLKAWAEQLQSVRDNPPVVTAVRSERVIGEVQDLLGQAYSRLVSASFREDVFHMMTNDGSDSFCQARPDVGGTGREPLASPKRDTMKLLPGERWCRGCAAVYHYVHGSDPV